MTSEEDNAPLIPRNMQQRRPAASAPPSNANALTQTASLRNTQQQTSNVVPWWKANEDEYNEAPPIFFLTEEMWDRYGIAVPFILFGYEFLATFITVFASVLVSVMVVASQSSSTTVFGVTPTEDQFAAAANDNSTASVLYFGIPIGGSREWNNKNVTVSIACAAVTSTITIFLALAMPGITAHPVLAFESFIIECVCLLSNRSTIAKDDTKLQVCGRSIMYMLKLVWVVGTQCLAAACGASFAAFCMSSRDYIQFNNYLKDHTHNEGNAIGLSIIFFFLYNWVFDLFYRISAVGHKPYFSGSSYYSFSNSALILSLANFIGVFVMFTITGSTLNFLVTFGMSYQFDCGDIKLENGASIDCTSWAPWYFFAGESVGGLCACAMAGAWRLPNYTRKKKQRSGAYAEFTSIQPNDNDTTPTSSTSSTSRPVVDTKYLRTVFSNSVSSSAAGGKLGF
jgi:hypothetical protein